MAIANWSSRFETGITVIDTQHKELFEAINAFADSFKSGTSSSQVKESLAFLLKYTIEHFETEEKLMREMCYPRLAEHAAAHAELAQESLDLATSVKNGNFVTMDVAVFVADWLLHHIYNMDMDYVAFARSLESV